MWDLNFKIAIVGSGPSGCYAAQFLNRSLPKSSIYIFEQLPVPYGLLRYGIAADHQGSKNISKQYDRLFSLPNVHFCGNVGIGKELSFEQISEQFNLVILATGLEHDKTLQIPIDSQCRIIGAGILLKSLNSHPQYITQFPQPLGSTVSLIGAGNVSLDVVRLLCAQKEHLELSDIYDEYLNAVRAKEIQHIDIFSRSSASESKFDLSMLKELLHMKHVRFSFIDDDGVFDEIRTAYRSDEPSTITVSFHFNASPESLQYLGQRNLMKVKRRSDEYQSEFYSHTVITAIGFQNKYQAGCGVADDWMGPHIHRVGWLRSGGLGTVAANRKSVKVVIDDVLKDIDSNQQLYTSPVLSDEIKVVIENSISFEQWKRIDAFEQRFKPSDRCRRKITTHDLMLMVASHSDLNMELNQVFKIA